jgi:hypothetical protein
MPRSPDQSTGPFENAYRLSRRHAQKFGWSRTNADIRLAAGEAFRTPALGYLTAEQQNELIAKWTLDLDGSGHPPTVAYELVKETVTRHKDRFGMKATRDALLKYGGSPWATNIKHALRQHVIDSLEAEINADIDRARIVAGKPPRSPNVVINVVNTMSTDLDRVQRDMKEFLADPDRASRMRGHGPVVASMARASTNRWEDVTIRFNAHVRVKADGKWGRVARVDCDTEGEECRGLVLIMDDLTTRTLTHEHNAVSLLDDIEPYSGGFLPKRKSRGAWIVDALRATRGALS